MALYFATTNINKLTEATTILEVPIEGISSEVEEIQSLDPVKVATQKAIDYYQKTKQPLFVEDVSLTFASLPGLPGPYIDGFFKALGNDGLYNLVKNSKDKTATAQTTIVYIDAKHTPQIFVGTMSGRITSPKGENGFGWDPIFIPDDHTQTLAELSPQQKNKLSMRQIALKKFATWYKTLKQS